MNLLSYSHSELRKAGIAKPCTHLYSSHFSLHPALQHPQRHKNQNIVRNWAISPNLDWKIHKLSILSQNRHTWQHEGGDFEPELKFSKFRPQNPLLGKFRPKKSKLSVLLGNWHTWYLDLEDADSYSGISFLNFQP